MTKIPEFLIWLICVGISAVLIGMYFKYSNNSLASPLQSEGFIVYTCPSGTSSYITDDGQTECCNGDVIDGYCTGNVRCSLSPKSKYPRCADVLASEAASKGSSLCPASMYNYFDAKNGTERAKGCTASQPLPDRSGPSDPNEPMCILYATRQLNEVRLDSCHNYTKNVNNVEKCAAAEATAALPACAAAASAANAAPTASTTCPPPPDPKFVITGDWVGARIPIQRKFVLPNGNIVHAVQQGEHTKMVVTDKNNLPMTSRAYQGPISELTSRAGDMVKINSLGDATGHYILSSAP